MQRQREGGLTSAFGGIADHAPGDRAKPILRLSPPTIIAVGIFLRRRPKCPAYLDGLFLAYHARTWDMLKILPLSSRMDAAIRHSKQQHRKCWAGATEAPCCGETRSFETASTYIGIISLNYFASPKTACFRHTHLFFSPYSLINQPPSSWGATSNLSCLEICSRSRAFA